MTRPRRRSQEPRARRPGLDDKRYWAARAQLKVIGNHVCAWCGYPIDMQVPSPHPLSWSADHRVPRSLLTDPNDPRHWHIENLQELHRRCNSARGAKPMPSRSTDPLNPSIDW